MTKTVLISLAVLTLASSTALAATDQKTQAATHRAHHHHAVNAAAAPAAPASPGAGTPGFWWGAPSRADHQLYLKNLHDSGLDRAGK
jgi:hypothetical protein